MTNRILWIAFFFLFRSSFEILASWTLDRDKKIDDRHEGFFFLLFFFPSAASTMSRLTSLWLPGARETRGKNARLRLGRLIFGALVSSSPIVAHVGILICSLGSLAPKLQTSRRLQTYMLNLTQKMTYRAVLIGVSFVLRQFSCLTEQQLLIIVYFVGFELSKAPLRCPDWLLRGESHTDLWQWIAWFLFFVSILSFCFDI